MNVTFWVLERLRKHHRVSKIVGGLLCSQFFSTLSGFLNSEFGRYRIVRRFRIAENGHDIRGGLAAKLRAWLCGMVCVTRPVGIFQSDLGN